MKRRKFIYQTSLGLGGFLPMVKNLGNFKIATGPFLTTGIKIGEVTSTEAIVWTRLAKNAKPVDKKALVPKAVYLDEKTGEWQPAAYFKEKYKEDRPNKQVKVIYPDGYNINNIEGAVPGTVGEVMVSYREKGNPKWTATAG